MKNLLKLVRVHFETYHFTVNCVVLMKKRGKKMEKKIITSQIPSIEI